MLESHEECKWCLDDIRESGDYHTCSIKDLKSCVELYKDDIVELDLKLDKFKSEAFKSMLHTTKMLTEKDKELERLRCRCG